jgi:hypothetical protein
MNGKATISGGNPFIWKTTERFGQSGGLGLGAFTAKAHDGIHGYTTSQQNGTAQIDFKVAVTDFGGYWAHAVGFAEVRPPTTFSFFNSHGGLVGSETFSYSRPNNNGTLEWQGWHFSEPVSRISYSGDWVANDSLRISTELIGIVSSGSEDDFDLTRLFQGSGMEFTIVTNTNADLVDSAISSEGQLMLIYTPNQTGTAHITIRASDPSNGSFKDAIITLHVVPEPEATCGAVTLNMANGLFEQVISVTNSSLYDVQSITLTVSDISEGATLYNTTGTNSDGTSEIHWVGTLASGSSMDFTLQYFTTSLGTAPAGTVTIAFCLDRPDVELDENNQVSLAGQMQSGSNFVVGFNAQMGTTYYVQYADTPAGPWKTAYPPITAQTEQVQWIDSGPPVTEPAGSSRFYRIIQDD